MSIPITDLASFVGRGRTGAAAERGAVGRQIDEACREVGFISVTGHGIAREIIDQAHRAALAASLMGGFAEALGLGQLLDTNRLRLAGFASSVLPKASAEASTYMEKR